MNNLQKDFLQRSVANLENLTESAQREETLSPELLREAFRTLHTIKGTSQTFGFANTAHLSHELENLLSAAKNNSEISNSDFKNTLIEGFELLIKSFSETNNSDSYESFLAKIRQLVPNSTPLENYFLPQIPEEISRQLSEYEKNSFASAMRAGKNIFCVKADFDFADFADGFKRLKENLSAKGEIIATLPNAQAAEKSKIGFLIYLASAEKEIAKKITRDFPAEIILQNSPVPSDLDGILNHIAAHGKDLARQFGKEVNFTISADKIELSVENLKLVFDVLLHLVRNAVDHAIETAEERIAKEKAPEGKIEISLRAVEKGFELFVKDDGKGIDAAKIRTKALEKNLVQEAQILTEAEMLDLIFLPEFSTRQTISEISGRGVGLDAVKNLIENAGGEIKVKSLKDSGTSFEIFLPKEF
jgi:chemotaxis protein histidine kinase CheA